MCDLMNKLNNSNSVNFVEIKNKWSEIFLSCCDNNCINTNKPIGNCIEGNGFGNIIDDENIKYINCLDGVCDESVTFHAENSFTKPPHCFNYSLYYFEIKCKFEGELNNREKWMDICLQSLTTDKYIEYCAVFAQIKNEKNEYYRLSTPLNNNDIFGCGLVYPPTNMSNESGIRNNFDFTFIIIPKNKSFLLFFILPHYILS
uniref:Uncharacterized protein n=1 Tax=Meloidogyne enterolobii TaxID=390850 RepID=A0A6V7W8V0_MELEN|nr:unnamed protein product [Meloidogyne enterolobii]